MFRWGAGVATCKGSADSGVSRRTLCSKGIVRLGGSLLMIKLGLGVPGVVAANAAAVAVAYLAAVPSSRVRHVASPLLFDHALRETFQAMIFFSGQVLINNCDIVLVKHFFIPTTAGLYAAIAMVGRVIFTFSSAVVNSMFPLVAGTRKEERRGFKVVATSSVLVLGIGAVLAVGLRLTPPGLWSSFFGSGFALAGQYGLPYLLSMYAITTILYCLSVVIITYEMSYKIANTSWVQLAFSGVLVAAICRFHSSLREVIWVQLILMIVLLVVVAVPFIWSSLADSEVVEQAAPSWSHQDFAPCFGSRGHRRIPEERLRQSRVSRIQKCPQRPGDGSASR
jgi:hypothetical protein